MRAARATYSGFDPTRSWELPDIDALPSEDWGAYLRRLGFDHRQLRYVERSFANACSEAMRFLSAKAVLVSLRLGEEDGSGDFRPLGGATTRSFTRSPLGSRSAATTPSLNLAGAAG